MMRRRIHIAAVVLSGVSVWTVVEAQGPNIVPNPLFEGTGGVALGVTLLSGGVPDQWRAFAVAGGAAEFDVIPVAADEVFPGSPAANSVLFRVLTFGGDQGFDDDNGRFLLTQGLDYHAEVYVRSANGDGSDQLVHIGFPLFDANNAYIGLEPGGLGVTVRADWQLYTLPIFRPPAKAAFGHISFRCRGDGGEDAIQIAFPSVTSTGELTYPTDLLCRRENRDVVLTWINGGPLEGLRVLRDDVEIGALDVAATTFRDIDVPEGVHTYQVAGLIGGLEDGPTCTIGVFDLPIGAKASVDFGDPDTEDGLANNFRDGPTDGENEFTICGPENELREGRSNFGFGDVPPDPPDALFYFNVTDPAMKAQSGYVVDLTVYDDPARAGTMLYLQYTNELSTGPADIPNTFFPLQNPPVNTLGGTGQWVSLRWAIGGAGFRSFQQGQSDFRIGTADGSRICVDRIDLTHFPPIGDLFCRRTRTGVELTWLNGGVYEAIKVLRGGVELAQLAGDAISYRDDSAPEGVNDYEVQAIAAGIEIGPRCSINVAAVVSGTRVGIDLGDLNVESGLANVFTGESTDGENQFVICGPEGDLREARASYGFQDPTPDFADPFFYFTVTDAAMKAQAAFRLEATVYDDPARAGIGLYLQYTIQESTGPGDIANTFFPLAGPVVNTLAGSGEWVILAWDIDNAGFRSFQQSVADFRLGTTDNGPICMDKVELIFPEAPAGKTKFHRGDFDETGQLDVTDAINILNYLFLAGVAPSCLESADADDSGQVDVTDAIVVLNFLFLAGEALPNPGPPPAACGEDRAGSPDVGCAAFSGCG